MSVFWNKRTVELSPYVPGEQPGGGVIKLNTNENPYPPSPGVIEALERVLVDGGGLRLYPDPLCMGFREAVAEAYGVRPEQVFPGNGSDEVLGFAFGALFEGSAGPVLFPDITYSFYPVYAKLWGLPSALVPLRAGFSIGIEDYLVPSCGVIFPNPNAPTGRGLPPGDIRTLAEYLLKNGRVLVIDEAYAAFGVESAVPFINDYPNLLTVHTLSKSASLAGLRAGFAIGSGELVEGLFRIRNSFNSYTMDRLALAGAAAAVADRAYYEGINKKIVETRERTAAGLIGLGFELVPSQANFLFTRKDGIEGVDLFRRLRERGILVRHFDRPRIAAYLRVSIGTDGDMDAFLEACAAITGPDRGG